MHEQPIWLLRHRNDEGYVMAIDGAVDCYMAFLDESDAIAEAERQNELHGLDCEAVLVAIMEDE